MNLLMFLRFNEIEKSCNEKTKHMFLETDTFDQIGLGKFYSILDFYN